MGMKVGAFLLKEKKQILLEKVWSRSLTDLKSLREKSNGLTLEVIINEALHQEQERLKTEKRNRETTNQKKFWSKVAHEFHQVDEIGREKILTEIIQEYAEEIVGNFNPHLHGLVARIIPTFLKILLTRITPSSFLTSLSSRFNLEDNLVISGPIDTIRKLSQKGTLILTPTHVSNLDSIVIGLGLYQSQLPPFVYGAGLNLFTNSVISFFMNNLGAYKVDRRKKNTIYKTVLKNYATLSMEMGEHNLFFPGGTRGRRGDIEQHLKLGLLGCGINVFTHNLQSGKAQPNLYVIPCTLSYGLVLEAKNLIDEHLQETGKARFIRIRNDFNRPMRLLNFWKNLQSLNSKIHMHLGEPLDLFGNAVNSEGQSQDRFGRPIDARKYVEVNGIYPSDTQRDQEYTRELGQKLLTVFKRNNIALATHITAYAAFIAFKKRWPHADLYQFLRVEGEMQGVSKNTICDIINNLMNNLWMLEKQQKILVDPALKNLSAQEIFDIGMQHFQSFHNKEVLQVKKDLVFTKNMRLLYYYRNRLDHYGLESE